MKIGIFAGATPGADNSLEGTLAYAKQVEAQGFASLWLANIFGLDAITTAALLGRETERLHFGTGVVPSFPRHPAAIAQQALTAQAASGGRFHLGIGLSHKLVIEDMLGLSYERPARHMREYVDVLAPLLRGEPAKHAGDLYRVNLALDVAEAAPVPLLVAALGDVMLRLAGRFTDGTVTWMTGPRTHDEHIVPKLRAGAEEAGRPTPRVVAGVPLVLTDQPEEARAGIGQSLAHYGMLPSYRAMLDKEGVAGPADLVLAGDEAELRKGLERLESAGVTEIAAALPGGESGPRTQEFLASLV